MEGRAIERGRERGGRGRGTGEERYKILKPCENRKRFRKRNGIKSAVKGYGKMRRRKRRRIN